MTIPYSAAKDTLQYQLGARPLTQRVDFSSAQMIDVMAEFLDDPLPGTKLNTDDDEETADDMPLPETEALWFYLLNHAVAEVRNLRHPTEPLGPLLPILETYHEKMADRAVRLFRYLMLICTREARHSASQLAWKDDHPGQSERALKYIRQEICHQSDSPQGAATWVAKHPPKDVTVGEYVNALRYVFYAGEWGKSEKVSYGGKKWGAVTDCMVEFVHGRYSAEMMLDTGWTLCHNGGPIFNKGMLYSHYSGAINMILDVQRSGQIPQGIAEAVAGGSTQSWEPFIDDEMKEVLVQFDELLGGRLLPKSYVDWYAVEMLGGLHNWKHLQKEQVKKYGLPPGLAEQQKKAELLKQQQELAAQAELAAKMANEFEIYPGEVVQKVKMVRAA